MTEEPAEPRPTNEAAPRRDVAVAVMNALRLGASLLATWAVALVVRFQLPRHLGPEAFGRINFAEGFAGAFFVAAGLGLDTYIQKEVSARPEHAGDFVGGAFAVRVAVSVVLLGLAALVLRATGRPGLVPVVVVFGVAQAVTQAATSLSALLQAATKVGRLAIVNVVTKLLWGFGTLGLLRVTTRLEILALPLLVAESTKALLLFAVARRELAFGLRVDLRATFPVLALALPYFVNTIAYSLGSKLDVAVLEFVAAPPEVGFYGAASTLSMLALLLSPLVSWVLMPLLTRAQRRSEEELFALLRRALEGVLVAAAPVSVVLAAGSPFFVRLAFGAAFAPAAGTLALLAPSFLLTYMAVLLATALIILGRPWAVTAVNLATTATQPLLIASLVPLAAGRLPPGGAGMINAGILTALELTTVTAFLVLLGRRAWDLRLVTSLGKSVVVAGLVLALGRALPAGTLGSALAVAGAYVVLAFAVRLVRLADVAALLRLVKERRA